MSNNPYGAGYKTGSQASIPTAATQLTAPSGVVGQLLVSCSAAFKYGSDAAGTFLDAELNSQTSRYEHRFPLENAFSKVWFKAGSGTVTLDWEAFLVAAQ